MLILLIYSISFTERYMTTWPVYRPVSVQNENRKSWHYHIVQFKNWYISRYTGNTGKYLKHYSHINKNLSISQHGIRTLLEKQILALHLNPDIFPIYLSKKTLTLFFFFLLSSLCRPACRCHQQAHCFQQVAADWHVTADQLVAAQPADHCCCKSQQQLMLLLQLFAAVFL